MNNNLLYKASLAFFEAQKLEALATLQIYFNTSVGISERSAHVQEIVLWTKKLSEAEKAITTLKRLIEPSESDVQPS